MPKMAAFLLLLSAAAAALPAARAQESPNAAKLLSDARENLRAYAEDARIRQAEVSRKIQVLRTLADAGDQISSFSMGISLDKVRGKLAEARRLAEGEPSLSEPVPSVLAALDELIAHPVGAPEQIKAKYFAAVSRLEEHVIQQATALEAEATNLENMERGIHTVQSGLRSVVSIGLSTVIHARRVAAK
jgi:hypothetical protein